MLYFYAADIRTNVKQIKQIYSQTIKTEPKQYNLLLNWSAFFIGICKIVFFLMSLVGLSLIFRPLVVYLFTSEIVMMVPVWVPGADVASTTGYTLTTAYHIFVCVLAVFGTIGSDSLIILFVLYMWPMCEIFDNMFAVINDSAKITSFRNSTELKRFIRNVLQMHGDICRYNLRLSKMYFLQCTVEVNTNGFSLCACVFCIMTVSRIEIIYMEIINFLLIHSCSGSLLTF